MNNKGQVAIWVIIAIALVASMILFFTFEQKPELFEQKEFNPEAFIDKCVRESVQEAVDIMLPQGGFLEPENFHLYENQKVAYLCLNRGYYGPCINQHPVYLSEIREEIKEYVMPRIESCFIDLEREIEGRNSDFGTGDLILNISLGPDRVNLDIQKKVTIRKGDDSRVYKNFEVSVVNPVYDLGSVAVEIASQEAKYCYFEYVGYMILYPRFDIRVFTFSDSTSIYSIKDKNTEKELNIAIRSCAIPSGI